MVSRGCAVRPRLGHTDPKVTIQHFIRRSEMVNPATAEVLDRVLAKDGVRERSAQPSARQ